MTTSPDRQLPSHAKSDSPTAGDKTAQFYELCFRGGVDQVREKLNSDPCLAKLGGSSQWEGGTPLTLAALGGHVEIARMLLENGASVDLPAADGTALLMAAWGSHDEMVKLLLQYRADPNIPSHSGETPLMAATFRGLKDIVRVLLEHGADIHRRTTSGASNFYTGSPPVCGETALHFAAGYTNADVVHLLLKHGADKNAQDRAGQRPVDWASRHKRNELINLLE
ncbi:MAG: ankyrin repeat domain-containing protein [Phycisphaeraceae bacterium]|nr:ankyrin repeat domain-containing protein [Phycisphaeraceae bacterium]